MKTYSIEMPRNNRAEMFMGWMNAHGITFESSAIKGGFVHLSISLAPAQVDAVNDALDEIVWKED